MLQLHVGIMHWLNETHRLTCCDIDKFSCFLTEFISRRSCFCIMDIIGQGGFGTVAKGVNLCTMQDVAIKILSDNDIITEREVSLLVPAHTFRYILSRWINEVLIQCCPLLMILLPEPHDGSPERSRPSQSQRGALLWKVPAGRTHLSSVWNAGQESGPASQWQTEKATVCQWDTADSAAGKLYGLTQRVYYIQVLQYT